MANLVAWARLDGNLSNKGSKEDILVNCESPQYVTGKVHNKALKVSLLNNPAYLSNVNVYEEETVMCWFNTQPDFTKTAPEYDKMTILTIGDNHEGICLFADKGDTLTLDVCTEKAVLRTSSVRYRRNVWNHVAVTLNQKTHTTKLYLNGDLVTYIDYPSGLHYRFFDYRNYGIGSLAEQGIYPLQGYISDFKVYDEELSLFGMQNASTGLYIYYKLDKGGDNLLNGVFNSEFTTFPNRIEIDDLLKSNVSGRKLTVSYDYLIRDISDVGTTGLNFRLVCINGVLDFRWDLEQDFNDNGTKEIVVQVPDNLSNFEYAELIFDGSARVMNISNIKLEFGTTRTYYKPNRSEKAFKALGYSKNEDDVSGNNDVGIYNKAAPEFYSENAKVFQSSPKFSGDIENVLISKNRHYIYNDLTCSFWFTPCVNTNGSDYQYVFSEGRPNIGDGFGAFATDTSITCIFGDKAVTAKGLKTNKWYNAAFSVDENYNLSLYIDGVFVESKVITKLPTYTDSRGLCIGGMATMSGIYYPFCGRISDFKLYNSCLNENMIYGYATSGVLFDSDNVIYCREAMEY